MVPKRKQIQHVPISSLPPPPEVCIPIGTKVSSVRTGDTVEAGQPVALSRESDRWTSVVHSPLAGTVTSVGAAIVIEGTLDHPREVSDGDVIDVARNAGLLGMGGGMFPTYAKLAAAKGRIDTIIVNGCESEPYVTCDHRVLVEHREALRLMLRTLVEALGAAKAIVVDREEAYPGGYERFIVQDTLGRQVPARGLPVDVGVLVVNVQTVWALYRATHELRPLIDRVVTVDGAAVARPGNYVVPIGTRIGHVLDACGVDLDGAAVVLDGGPMMGRRVTPDDSVQAGTIAVLALGRDEIDDGAVEPCLRCGRCMEACPLGLPAVLLAMAARPPPVALECIECGLCAYACPARRPLVPLLRRAKAMLRAEASS